MTRRRGRPPKSDDPATRDRLLDAAAAACIDVGFDAVTLAGVAARAGVTPAAVYNHFAGKEELLYAAGRVAIERLGTSVAPGDDAASGAHDIVAAFLGPSFRSSRRLILELHLAGTRHPELAGQLEDWHREFASLSVDQASVGDDAPEATVKALFLLLLGLCHVDDLAAIEAAPAALHSRIDRLVDALYPRQAPTSKTQTRAVMPARR